MEKIFNTTLAAIISETLVEFQKLRIAVAKNDLEK